MISTFTQAARNRPGSSEAASAVTAPKNPTGAAISDAMSTKVFEVSPDSLGRMIFSKISNR